MTAPQQTPAQALYIVARDDERDEVLTEVPADRIDVLLREAADAEIEFAGERHDPCYEDAQSAFDWLAASWGRTARCSEGAICVQDPSAVAKEKQVADDSCAAAERSGMRLHYGHRPIDVKPYRFHEFLDRCVAFEWNELPSRENVLAALRSGERVKYGTDWDDYLTATVVADEQRREQESSQAAARRAELADALRQAPASRTFTRLVPDVGSHVGQEVLVGTELHVVTDVQRAGRISGDDPSIHGEHLLGHEGERGFRVTVEVRSDGGTATG